MTGTTLAASLVERGLDPCEIDSKAALFDLVLSRFAELQRQNGLDAPRARPGVTETYRDVHAWWVPGRLEVFGKHTDYAGGRTLVCAVPRGFAVVARPRNDGMVHVVDARRDQEVTLVPAEPPPAAAGYTGWRHYVDVVSRRLARNFPGAPLGADIVIASDLPRASGMSSSSALVIAIASALARVGALDRRAEWAAHIAGPRDVAGYFACLENGLSFGGLPGDAGVGTHGGSEDHAAILTATPGHLAAFAFVPLRAIDVVPVPDRWRFVLTPCGVASQKTGTAREAYNRLAGGTQVLLDLWNSDSRAPAPSVAAALVNSGGTRDDMATTSAADRLRALVRRSQVPGWSSDALEKRLDHFIHEDARIPEAVEAFRHADAEQIGRLADGSQADAELLLGNQIPETSALARSARDLGAFASCSFGAGFGGSVWALVDHDRAESFARSWHADAFIASPGTALVELTSGDRL